MPHGRRADRRASAAEAVCRRVEANRAALAAEVAERSRCELGPEGLARRLGCRTAVGLVQRVTGAAGVTASRLVRLGRAVRPCRRLSGEPAPSPFPHVARAMAERLLGADAAVAVVDTLRPTLRGADALAVEAAEWSIVDEAVAQSPDASPRWDAVSVRAQAQVWVAVLDPDGAEPTESDLKRRGLQLLAPRHGLVPEHVGLPEVKAPPGLDPDQEGRRSRGSPQAVLDAITTTTGSLSHLQMRRDRPSAAPDAATGCRTR